MTRKRECLIRYALIFLALAYVLFVTVYDYSRIVEHSESLKAGDGAVGYALAMMIIFVFFNVCLLGGGSLVLTIVSFFLTRNLSKPSEKSKKGVLIALLVCEIVGLALTVFGAILAFSYDHCDWAMRVVYTLMPTAYLVSVLHGVVFFKKIVANE